MGKIIAVSVTIHFIDAVHYVVVWWGINRYYGTPFTERSLGTSEVQALYV